MRIKKEIIIGVIFVLAISFLYFRNFKKFNFFSSETSSSPTSILSVGLPPRPTNPDLSKIYDDALASEEIIKKDPKDYEAYLDGGLAWKSLGDLTNDLKYYDLSAEVYRKGTEGYGQSFYVLWLNLGNVKTLSKKYEEAEKAYQDGLKIFPEEPSLYLALIEMYRYGMKKSPEVIIDIYEEALEKVKAKEKILNSYAPYLKEIGNYKLALFYFEQLAKVYPSEEIFKKEIFELKAKNK